MLLAAKRVADIRLEQTDHAFKQLIYHIFCYQFWRVVYQQQSDRIRSPYLGK
jgi:hypothetical protein